MGHSVFEAWMGDPGRPDAIIAQLRWEFVLGGHKAAAIALPMQQAAVYLVSDMPHDLAQSMGFHAFDSLDSAVGAALRQSGDAPNIVVMPEGASTLPGAWK